MSCFTGFTNFICVLCIIIVVNDGIECDTSWTDITSTFTIPDKIDSLFLPFKLSNYLFIIGSSTMNDNEEILIYYHNLNNYTSLLSSLYDKSKVDFKLFKNELNKIVSRPLKWNLLNKEKQLFSESNDTIYPFLAYPSTYFVDERSNDIYIIAPIEISKGDETISNSLNAELWKLHIDIKSSLLVSSKSNVDISFYWENMGMLLYDIVSSCVVYDEIRDTAFIFGGIDKNGRFSDKVQAFNLLNETWSFKSNMISPRRLSSCSLFGDNNNFIYIFGGNGIEHYGTIEIYDIINDKFIQLNDDIIFPFTRYATSAIQLQKRDTIYIIGGLLNDDTATSRIGIFSPYNNTLEICTNSNNTLPINRGAAISLVISDTIWTFGGLSNFNGNNNNLQFDSSITIGISYNEYLYDIKQHNNVISNSVNNDNNNNNNVHSIFSLITFDIAIIILIISLYCLLCIYFMIKCIFINKKNRNSGSMSMSLLNHPEMVINTKKNRNKHSDDTLSSSEMTEMGLRSLNSLSPSCSFPPIIPTYFDDNDNYINYNDNESKQLSSTNQITSFNRSSMTGTITTQQYQGGQPILHYPSITLNTPSRHNVNGSKAPLLNSNNYDSTQKQRVINWLKYDVGLKQYIDNFFQHGFDRMIFVENITNEDLIDMKIKKPRHRKRILQQIKSYTNKQQKFNQINHGYKQKKNISKSMSALTKNYRKMTRQKHAKSANHLRGVPSSESIVDHFDKTFDSSDLYLSNQCSMDNDNHVVVDDDDNDDDSLYINHRDQESKDGDKETDDIIMGRSSTTTAIRGSDDDDIDIQQKFRFNPNLTQNRRNRTRKRYQNRANSSNASKTSLSSVTSSNLSFNNNDHYNKYMLPLNSKHTFDSQTTFTVNDECSPSATSSSLAPSSLTGSTLMNESHINMIHPPPVHPPVHPPPIYSSMHRSIHPSSIHMNTASIQSAMKAAYSTLDGPRDDILNDIDYAVMDINSIDVNDINDINDIDSKSSVSDSMSGIWDSPKYKKNNHSEISGNENNENSKTNNNSVEGGLPTHQQLSQ